MSTEDHPLYAAVNAALKATNEAGHHYITNISVTVALEAAAPHLMRAAWDEGWEAHGDWGGPTPNPYRTAK